MAQSPELIFHSGFEPDVDTIDHDSGGIDIVGIDKSVSSPNDWVKDLEEHPNIGSFKIQFQGGDKEDRIAEIVKDPIDPTNNVLHFWNLNPNSGSRGRIQANIYENNGLHVIYYSVRLFLPGDFNILKNAPFDWHFTIQEFWNNANWTGEDYMFRMRVHLNKMLEAPDSLRIDVGGQIRDEAADNWGDDIWEYYNTEFVVPVQKWMTLRTYIVEGDENTGRFIFTITPDGGSEQIVHNVRNYTHHPNDPNPDGLSHINPIKLYSSDEIINYVRDNGGVLNCYWDDFEFWKDSVFSTNEAPVIICPTDIEVENDEGDCGAIINYDLPRVKDNRTNVSVKLTSGLGSGSFFPVGTSIETYTATDGAGNTSTCSISITVLDTELPVITLSRNKKTKWPPDHKPFELNFEDYIESVWDNCGGVSVDDVIIDEVSSDEENNSSGDGNTEDDIVISNDCRTIQLRAERKGNGNGRVYTINLALMDTHGNIGVAAIKAEITHDQGKNTVIIDDGPVYVVNGCDLVSDEEEENSASTGSNNEDNEISGIEIETFPNPFQTSFDVKFRSNINDWFSIDVYNLSGVKVKHLFEGNLLGERNYCWTFHMGYTNEKILLLVLNSNRTFAVRKIYKE